MPHHPTRRALLFATLTTPFLLPRRAAAASEIRVLTSGGFNAAYGILGPAFEQATGHRLITARGASMGNAPDAIPQRLGRGEPADVVILAAEGLDGLVAAGHVVPGSRVDLAESLIGMAVKSGAPRPDISTEESFRRTLLEARSIAYSASASGVYLSTQLFQRMGIAEQVMPKARRILSERVGTIVARGEAEIGFQQVSELLPIEGIDYIGAIPRSLQQITTFSAGIVAKSTQPEAARALIAYLAAPAAREVIQRTGMDPLPR
jgi:molybdate transport system substrate-binding protein